MSTLSTQLQLLHKSCWAYGRTPLCWAIMGGMVEAVQYLLSTGADPNEADQLGSRALHECVNLLSDPSKSDVIVVAPAIAELLLSAGADVKAVTLSGRSALHQLFCHNRDKYSLESGTLKTSSALWAQAEYTSRQCSETKAPKTFVASVHRIKSSCQRLLTRALLQWGADVMSVDREGNTALHYCVRDDTAGASLVELLRHRADPYHLDAAFGRTALHSACVAGAARNAHILSRWDADARHLSKGLAQLQDKKGKIPGQLLPSLCDPNCLVTLWSACRSGNEEL